MIILDSTDKSLEVLLDSSVSANEAVFSSNYVDISQTDFGVDAVSSNDGETNGTTAVTMISAPSADTSRQVKYLSIYNADTASVDVEVRINNNGTFRSLVNITLSAGKTLQYTNDTGWQTADVNSLSVIESTLAGATDKDPFDDTDNIVGVDSGGSLIKNTWANIKTILNGIYATLSGGNDFAGLQEFQDGISFDGGGNVLSEYEAGTWTPTVVSTGTNPSVTYTSQAGVYVRVGTLVSIIARIDVDTISGGSGSLAFGGLPFAIPDANENRASFQIGFARDFSSTASPKVILAQRNDNITLPRTSDSADSRDNTTTEISVPSSPFDIWYSGTYIL